MRISKSTVLQYFLIYLMMILNGGTLYRVLQNSMPSLVSISMYIIVAIGVLAPFFRKRKYGNQYCILISIILLISVILVRLSVGGVGINALMDYLVCIMVAFLAVCVDKNKFVTRLINVVYFFALISVICYLLQLFVPNLLKIIFKPFDSMFSYNDWSDVVNGGVVKNISYTAWGKLIYTFREGEMTRNLGIYTEPGNYQIVLNSVLYLLLFLPDLYYFNQKQIKKRFIVLIAALLTCQSTTGYLIFFVLCVSFFITSNHYKDIRGMRRVILVCVLIAIGVIIIDYSVRGNSSLLYSAIISKLFNDGNLDVSTSTGIWRLGAIGTSLELMLTHPFGSGFDLTLSTIQSKLSGSAGGALMTFGAALGIFPFLATIIWFIRPILRDRKINIPAKIAFIFMYLQTCAAQSKVFYPFFVAIIIVIIVTKYRKINNENNSLNNYDLRKSPKS